MSQRFIRCAHCGMPHALAQTVCPATGKTIDRRSRTSVSSMMVAERVMPPEPPPRPAPAPAPAPAPIHHQASTLPPGRGQPQRDLTGKTIGGKYKVRAVLGEGGMGTVFEAENIAIGRSVAVKVLHPTQARKKVAVKRFHQEARAAGAIGHPNICEVYDLGTLDDGSPYLVMEKLVGETLADRIASEGGLPFDDVIDVLTQVLSGLVAAHEKGIVHRDIKPENIFLTKRVGCPPVAKLLDFGVSKMISPLFSGEREEDLDLTRTGMVMGTPFYMSPEQARGDRNLDARVDLYACGVILYEALTGRRPFTAANYNALLLQILTSSPRPARELRPALPLGFDEVLDKALARAREDRFQSAAEFQRELQTLRDRQRKVGGLAGAEVAELARQALQRKVPPLNGTPIVQRASTPQQQARSPLPPRPSPPRYEPPPARRLVTPEPPPIAAYEPPVSHVPSTYDPAAYPNPEDAPPTYAPPPPHPPFESSPFGSEIEPRYDSELPILVDSATPSSVEIPVLFSDTPLSGEAIPQLGSGDVELVASSESAFDDLSTEISYRAKEERREPHDPDATERQPEVAPYPPPRRARGGTLRSAVPSSARKLPQPPPPEFKASDTDVDDNTATIVQSTSTIANLRRRPTKIGVSPDDTVRMDPEQLDKLGDPRDRATPVPAAGPSAPRAPKIPR